MRSHTHSSSGGVGGRSRRYQATRPSGPQQPPPTGVLAGAQAGAPFGTAVGLAREPVPAGTESIEAEIEMVWAWLKENPEPSPERDAALARLELLDAEVRGESLVDEAGTPGAAGARWDAQTNPSDRPPGGSWGTHPTGHHAGRGPRPGIDRSGSHRSSGHRPGRFHPTRGGTHAVRQEQIVDMIKQRGDHDKASQADSELSDKVDTDKHSGMLDKFGINVGDLTGKLPSGLGR